MNAEEIAKSPVIQFLDLAWTNANASTAHSWERLNHAMRKALGLAVGSGFRFAVGDVKYIRDHYRSERWMGDGDEWVYALAVAVENTSAIESYEAAHSRQPIIADDVHIEARGGFTHGSRQHRQRERLVVGAEFPWKGHQVKCTSFAADSSYANACSYKPRKKGEYGDKIDKRFKIGRADIITERAESKRRREWMARLSDAAKMTGIAGKMLNALGAKTMDEFMRLPLKKIEAVAQKFNVSLTDKGPPETGT